MLGSACLALPTTGSNAEPPPPPRRVKGKRPPDDRPSHREDQPPKSLKVQCFDLTVDDSDSGVDLVVDSMVAGPRAPGSGSHGGTRALPGLNKYPTIAAIPRGTPADSAISNGSDGVVVQCDIVAGGVADRSPSDRRTSDRNPAGITEGSTTAADKDMG